MTYLDPLLMLWTGAKWYAWTMLGILVLAIGADYWLGRRD